MKTIHAITSGEYPDYRVVAVCEDKKTAEVWADALRNDPDSWHSDARVEELPIIDHKSKPEKIHAVYLNQDLWDIGTEGELRILERDEFEIVALNPIPVRPSVRFVRAPVHSNRGGRLEIVGRSKQSVMKVYSEQRAMWLSNPQAFKAK